MPGGGILDEVSNLILNILRLPLHTMLKLNGILTRNHNGWTHREQISEFLHTDSFAYFHQMSNDFPVQCILFFNSDFVVERSPSVKRAARLETIIVLQ